MDIKILENLFQVTIERGTVKTLQSTIGAAEHDRSGRPEEISWDSLQKVDPQNLFSAGMRILQGTET